MKHAGKARKAAFKMILISLLVVIAIWAIGAFTVTAAAVIAVVGAAITPFVAIAWVLFALFTL